MIETLANHFKAGYSALYISSPEEDRVEAVIKAASEKAKRTSTWIWSITEGWRSNGDIIDCQDPIGCLDYAINEIPEMSVLILRDYHQFFNDPMVIRKFRDCIKLAKATYKTFVLISPFYKITEDIKHEITLIEFSMPTRDELEGILSALAEGNEKIEIDKEDKPNIVDSLCGLTAIEAEDALSLSAVKSGSFDTKIILDQKAKVIKASGILEYIDVTVNISDVGGLDILKDWLAKRGKAFSKEASDYGLPNPKGVLLMGPPGTGKSLIAKAIGSIWNRPILRLDMGNIRSSLQGESEANLRQAISMASAISPSIMWLDEIEKAVSGSEAGNLDSGVGARLLGTMLTWMQEKKEPVFLVATSNDVTALRPELLSRFDNIFSCDLPNENERKEIFSIHISKRNRDPEKFDLDKLAGESDELAGREIERSIESAMFDAFDQQAEIDTTYILNSVKSIEPISKTMESKIKSVRDWAKKHATPASTRIEPKAKQERKLIVEKSLF